MTLVNVPDGPRAQRMVRCSRALIEQQVGIETVTHYCCRDRNLLGMLSDLLGASAIGLKNMLIITGDPPKMGPYPNATAVFDIDAIGLTNLVNNLNHGLDPGGNSIGAPTGFAIGVGVNPGAIDLEHELKRFTWKVEAGPNMRSRSPCSMWTVELFLAKLERIAFHHCGIWPLVSIVTLSFWPNEVRGHCSAARHRADAKSERKVEGAWRGGRNRDRARNAERVRPSVQGVQVSARSES